MEKRSVIPQQPHRHSRNNHTVIPAKAGTNPNAHLAVPSTRRCPCSIHVVFQAFSHFLKLFALHGSFPLISAFAEIKLLRIYSTCVRQLSG